MSKLSLVLFWILFSLNVTQAQTFRVGVSLPLTGPLAEYGEAFQNGVDLARTAQPDLFRNIAFIYEDNAYDPKQAVSTLQKLVKVDHVNLLLIWGNEPALSVAHLAEREKVPTIAIAQYAKVSKGRNYVIRFLNTGFQYSETLLAYLRQEKVKRIAIVKSELSFFNMLIDGLKDGAKDESIDVVDTFLSSETDFRASIVELKNKNFDILGVYLTPPQLRIFFKQAAQLDFYPKTFGATPFESKSVIADSWALMNGAVFTHNAVTETFRNDYVSRYKNDMQLAYAANAYDFAMLTGNLFKSESAGYTPSMIIDKYSTVLPATGASGPYHFSNTVDGGKHFVFDIVVRKIEEKRTEEVFRSHLGAKNEG